MIRTTSTPPAASTSISTGQLLAALVAVLDRVHRRLGDGGLQLLEPPRLEAERRDRGGDALHRLALVARPARDAERDVERPARRRAPAALRAERDERDVVLLLPARAGEALRGSTSRPSISSSPLATNSASRGVPYISRVGRVRLGDAVGVEQQRLAGGDRTPPSPRRPSRAAGRAASRSRAARRRRPAVRAYGRLCPAFAKRKRPEAGSITP